MMEWQPIEIEPEDGQMCVVYDPDNHDLKVWPAEYSAKNKCFFSGSYGCAGWFEYEEITCWMPLPKPPQGA